MDIIVGDVPSAPSDSNLRLQDNLYGLRAETKDAFDEAKALEARWRELEREQREVYQVRSLGRFPGHAHAAQRFTPQFLLMRLRHATTAQDELSEALASSFVQTSSIEAPATHLISKEIDDFVKEFKDLRKTYHKRVVWGDRWAAGQVAWSED